MPRAANTSGYYALPPASAACELIRIEDPMADTAVAPEIKDLGDKIAKLTIVQAVALREYLKQEYKIEPAAGGGGGGGGGGAPVAAAEKPAEQTEFAVVL